VKPANQIKSEPLLFDKLLEPISNSLEQLLRFRSLALQRLPDEFPPRSGALSLARRFHLRTSSSSRSDGLNLAVGFQPTGGTGELFPVALATIESRLFRKSISDF
jgi:hypothetical protein